MEGKLLFDEKRHQNILNLPVDYPRINQFQEWFIIDEAETYSIRSNKAKLNGEFKGSDLKRESHFIYHQMNSYNNS